MQMNEIPYLNIHQMKNKKLEDIGAIAPVISRTVIWRRSVKEFRKIHRKAQAPESLF